MQQHINHSITSVAPHHSSVSPPAHIYVREITARPSYPFTASQTLYKYLKTLSLEVALLSLAPHFDEAIW
jgi:hypothetical protein